MDIETAVGELFILEVSDFIHLLLRAQDKTLVNTLSLITLRLFLHTDGQETDCDTTLSQVIGREKT